MIPGGIDRGDPYDWGGSAIGDTDFIDKDRGFGGNHGVKGGISTETFGGTGE